VSGERFIDRLLHSRESGERTAVTETEHLARVESVGEAQRLIPFAIREPVGLGLPDSVATTPSDQASPKHATVVFRYGTTPYGPVTVMQQAGEQVVTIRGGVEALLDMSPTGSMLRWIEGGVVFTVIAPSAGRNQLLELAERL